MNSAPPSFIAHVRSSDGMIQSLEDHLHETADICSLFASAIGLPLCGRFLGLVHDLGKYSARFQKYIREVTGLLGEAAKASAEKEQGTIDHATAGAQLVWDAAEAKRIPCYLAQVLGVVIMSHHSRSGMKDFIDLRGRSPFLERLQRVESNTHKRESLENAAAEIRTEIEGILGSPELVEEFKAAIVRINATTRQLVLVRTPLPS